MPRSMNQSFMGTKLIIAILFFIGGALPVVDWLYYCSVTDNNLEWAQFKTNYFNRFPSSFHLFFQYNIITAISIILLTVSGFLFVKTHKKYFQLIGAIAFILAFWQLFSLM